jgi:hypothetical protein
MLFFNLVCSAFQTLFMTAVGHLTHEVGLGELFEAGINELREVDLGGCEHKVVETLRSAGDGVSAFISDGAKHLVDRPPAEPR